MSEADSLPDGRPLASLRVSDLKAELSSRGLVQRGVKAALVERLRDVRNIIIIILFILRCPGHSLKLICQFCGVAYHCDIIGHQSRKGICARGASWSDAATSQHTGRGAVQFLNLVYYCFCLTILVPVCDCTKKKRIGRGRVDK